MIKFMVLSAGRSGSAWAANWLTTDKHLCLHDPLFRYHYHAIDTIQSARELGVACSGLALFPEFVNRHPSRKVILHRDFDEIDASARREGLGPLDRRLWEGALNEIVGLHVPWLALFENPDSITRHLFDESADMERHAFLRSLNVQRDMSSLDEDPVISRTLRQEIFNKRGIRT